VVNVDFLSSEDKGGSPGKRRQEDDLKPPDRGVRSRRKSEGRESIKTKVGTVHDRR